MKTADCVPLLIGDPRTGSFAAVHAGWRGTFAGIVFYAIERITKEYGVNPQDLRVAIGPAAGICCYEVGAEVIDGFRERFPYADQLFSPTREGHARVDLLKANHTQLIDAGVPPNQIHTSPLCTMTRTDLFFSYRREKQSQGKVGRLMSVIGRRGKESAKRSKGKGERGRGKRAKRGTLNYPFTTFRFFPISLSLESKRLSSGVGNTIHRCNSDNASSPSIALSRNRNSPAQ